MTRTASLPCNEVFRRLVGAAACFAAFVVAAPQASAGEARPDTTLEDFSEPLRGWRVGDDLQITRTRLDGDDALALRRARGADGWSGALTRRLPRRAMAVSLDVALAPGAEAGLFDAPAGSPAVVLRRTRTALVVTVGASRHVLRERATGRPFGDAHHVEAVVGRGLRLAIDGVVIEAPVRPARSLAVRVRRGRAVVDAFLASPAGDRKALLLHRVAAIRATTPPRRAPLGVGIDGTTRYHGGWTRGFWPGALWHATDLTRGSEMFAHWALRATVGNFGSEGEDTHDLGFMYGRSSVAAHERLCTRSRRERACGDLRRSGFDAADSLAGLAETNAVAGMIPTRSESLCRGCASLDEADTIIDSMMNLSLLLWAARESPGRARYRDIAVRHAQGVARHLVREDGSTAQAVHTRRADGAVIAVHTHQGVSDSSTWARGQAWAVYGFAETSTLTRSREFLAIAERTAGFVESRASDGLVPRYDYDAPPGSPTDTSAAVIAAAGLFRLEDACRSLRGCEGRGPRWGDLGERMLDAALRSVRRGPPLGLFGGQVFSYGGVSPWDDSGEFIFGVDYALEAVSRAQARRGG